MVTLKQIQDLDNQYNSVVNTEPAARDAAIGKIKTDTGYDTENQSLQQIKKSALDTQRTLDSLPQDVQRRTSGRLVTNSQLNHITSNEQTPLVKAYTNLQQSAGLKQGGLDSINNQIQQMLGLRKQDTDYKLSALQNQKSGLMSIYQQQQQAAQAAAAQAEARRQAEMQNRLAQSYFDAQQKEKQDKALNDQRSTIKSQWQSPAYAATEAPKMGFLEQALYGLNRLGIIGGKFADEYDYNANRDANAGKAEMIAASKSAGAANLNTAKRYLQTYGMNPQGLSDQQILQKARELGL